MEIAGWQLLCNQPGSLCQSKAEVQIIRASDNKNTILITRNFPFLYDVILHCLGTKISRVFWRAQVLDDDPCMRDFLHYRFSR